MGGSPDGEEFALATVSAYKRPHTIDEALALLAAPGAVPIGGGTKVNATSMSGPVVIVDLQALGLDRIERLGEGKLRIGATVTLQELADDREVPDVVREAARREQPSTLRAASTVGGCVAAADTASELLAALLAHDAVSIVVGPRGVQALELARLLSELPLPVGRLVTGLTIDTSGVASAARVARTRADRPIVAAVARRAADGRQRLALAGVAATPVLVPGVAGLEPPGDFRGSSEYRLAVAATLSARVLEAVA